MATITYIVGTATDLGGNQYPWTNPGYITAQDGYGARRDGLYTSSLVTSFLRGTNCGFSIPQGSTINSVQVNCSCSNLGGMSDTWTTVYLTYNGSQLGTQKTPSITIPAGSAYALYYTTADLWGTTLSSSIINSSTFGAAVCFTLGRGNSKTEIDPGIIAVDYISITVNYTPSSSGSSSLFFCLG